MSGLIAFLKLIVDSGAVSPKAPTEVTPPSSDAGFRPDCGLGSKAILIQPDDTGKNDYWVCVPSFK
tara:strand:+ start:1667 stop:1864 length:198 start_codon:yes stop_codon:yes gene_type:complete